MRVGGWVGVLPSWDGSICPTYCQQSQLTMDDTCGNNEVCQWSTPHYQCVRVCVHVSMYTTHVILHDTEGTSGHFTLLCVGSTLYPEP